MSNNDDFRDGMIAAAVLGLAAYGAYKVVQNIRKSPEQRLLENLGRDLRAIDDGYNQEMLEIPYDDGGDDDDN